MKEYGTSVLYRADSLTFDYSKLKPVDYIFSSPPFSRDGQFFWGNTALQHLQRCISFFEMIMDKTGAGLALIHTAHDHFTRITSSGVTPVDFAVKIIPNRSGKWETFSDSDIYALMSRYFRNPMGKTMLDPFCGSGHFLKVAKNLGMNVIGIDISENEIKAAMDLLETDSLDSIGVKDV